MKPILALMLVVALSGCASYHSVYGPNGELREKTSDYSITVDETFDANGKVLSRKRTEVPFVPDRFYSDALDKLGPMISQFSPLIGQIMAYLEKKNTPIPTPAPPAPVPAPVPPTPVPPVPTPTPVPVPTPQPPTPPVVASTVFSQSGNTLTLDLNTLPGSMRAAGFQGSDNALYYVMAHVYAYGPAKHFVPHAELDPLNTDEIRTAMFNWFDGEVLKVIATMKASPGLNLVAISNDGKDRCGFRLGPAILSRTGDAGLAGRSTLGQILPPEQY